MPLSRLARFLRRRITCATFRIDVAPAHTHLWSKGIAHCCDRHGPDGYWKGHTEALQQAGFFREHYAGASGIIWLRLGTRARHGQTCDLDRFAEEALPTITRPFILVTTDGDATVPEDILPATVQRLLSSPFLVRWYTQNRGDAEEARIAPFPIGLDLHTPRRFSSSSSLARLLEKIRRERTPAGEMPLHVFCDTPVAARYPERLQATQALEGVPHVTMQRTRLTQEEVWRCYASAPFVISAAGNGLDSHRTWEALCLGSIVITRRSSLAPLFDGLPVVMVDDWGEVHDLARLKHWQALHARQANAETTRERLSPATWVKKLRKELQLSAQPPS